MTRAAESANADAARPAESTPPLIPTPLARLFDADTVAETNDSFGLSRDGGRAKSGKLDERVVASQEVHV